MSCSVPSTQQRKLLADLHSRMSTHFINHIPIAVADNSLYSQLMELLLDVNCSAQIPADKRIDLSVETPSLADVPPLVTSEELAEAAGLDTTAGQAVYKDICSILEEKVALKAASKPPKSLAYLLNNTPHISTRSPLVSPELLKDLGTVDGTGAIAYLTADQIDDYICDIDISLGKPSTTPHPQTSPQDNVAHKNPVSVYNWLRRNEPKIFLQDGEGSEKSHGKPGSLRGAGKRASMPMPSHGDALEIVEEDGLGYDPTIAGLDPGTAKGKRKREDDGGYHPKLGAPDGKVKKPRISRKKKESTGETPTASAKKGKGKARVSSPMVIDSANVDN